MPFIVFRIPFSRSMMSEFNTTINKSLIFKTHNQSNVHKLGRWIVKIRQTDKCV